MIHAMSRTWAGRAGRGLVQAALIAAALAGAAPAALAQAVTSSRFYRVVARGQRVKISSIATLDPDCRSQGRVTINLIEAPRGGEVGVSYGSDFVTYVPPNPRAACNSRRVPATLLFYRANADFVGNDTFAIEDVGPNGVAQTARFSITVR